MNKPKKVDVVENLRSIYRDILNSNNEMNEYNFPLKDFLHDVRYACSFMEEYDLTKYKLEPIIEEAETYPKIKHIGFSGDFHDEILLNGHKSNDLWVKLEFENDEAYDTYTELAQFRLMYQSHQESQGCLYIHNSAFEYYFKDCLEPNKLLLEDKLRQKQDAESVLTNTEEVLNKVQNNNSNSNEFYEDEKGAGGYWDLAEKIADKLGIETDEIYNALKYDFNEELKKVASLKIDEDGCISSDETNKGKEL